MFTGFEAFIFTPLLFTLLPAHAYAETVLVKKEQLIPAGTSKPLSFAIYNFSNDNKKLLIYTNTAKVWRYNTRGDYWVLDIPSGALTQVGKDRPSQSLMFAKISPDS